MGKWSRYVKWVITAGVVSILTACSGGGEPMAKKSNISVQRNSFAPMADPRILMMGDSLMAWNATSGSTIGDRLAANLGEPVLNNSVVGATVLSAVGKGIAGQFEQGSWDWVVMNGGGNDLWLGCGCMLCDFKIDRLISSDGRSGKIPETIARLRSQNINIVYIGYLRTPGMLSPVDHCRPIGNRLEARIASLAARTPGFDFLSNADLVPSGDRSYHTVDMIHPSIKGSDAIGRRIANHIRNVEGFRVTNAF